MAASPRRFDAKAEQFHYAREPIVPVTVEDLDRLEADMRLWVPEFPGLFKGKTILDLGAGKAPLGTLVAMRFSPARVVSAELGFHRLRSGLPWSKQLDKLDLVCGDAFSLPFRESSFNYVLANSLLPHLPDVRQAAREIARVLCPGGLYIGREPNFNNPFVLHMVFTIRKKLFGRQITPNEYPLRAQEILRAFAEAGCDCEIGYFWRRLPSLRHPILSAAMSVYARRL